MNILISNDDGYLAPGLAVLARVCAEFANVRVVAPERDRSGVSNSLTLDRPLQLKQAENGFYYVSGTPTDCIHVGQHALADFKPDLVLSGINNGANMGDDTLYSGTVAAATEAYLMGIPAIAFSLADSSGRYWETAEKAAWILLSYFLKHPISEPILWNINIPAVAPEDIQGIKLHGSAVVIMNKALFPCIIHVANKFIGLGRSAMFPTAKKVPTLANARPASSRLPPCKSI